MKWTQRTYQKFADDLERMGYEVREYRGRYGFHGPAVSCAVRELQDVLRATDVRVVWDELGKGLIVYPDCRGRIQEEIDRLRFDAALREGFGITWTKEGSQP